MSHGRIMCSCGATISQCRCPNDVILETRPHPACEGRPLGIQPSKPWPNPPGRIPDYEPAH